MKYRFTVFTPCYNSEKFIHRVYNSLINQTYKDFEWLVINDASTDNTSEIIKSYIDKAPFDVQFFDLKKNQMITKSLNLAVKHAKGELFLPIGHDDEILPNALEKFNYFWEQYGGGGISGISCLCRDQFGNLVGNKFPQDILISNYFDIIYHYKTKGEKWGCIKTKVMQEFLQDESIDKYISEANLWKEIGSNYQTIYVNEILRIYYINQEHHSLSSTSDKLIRYPKGIAFECMQMINKYHAKIKGNYILKIKSYINYVRMSLHSNYKILDIFIKITKRFNKIIVGVFFILGYILYRKDIRDKRVVYRQLR